MLDMLHENRELTGFTAASFKTSQKPAVFSEPVIRAKNRICTFSASDNRRKKMRKEQLLGFGTSGAEEYRYSKGVLKKRKEQVIQNKGKDV